MMRPLRTVYYDNTRCRDEDVILVTHGSNRNEIIPNIVRRLSSGKESAVLVESYDEDTAELLAVVTYKVGRTIHVSFHANVGHPICITNIQES